MQILSAAAFVQLTIGVIKEGWAHGWIEGVAILLAIVIIVSITAVNNYMKEK
jgi:Ca2+ transporting ATPase